MSPEDPSASPCSADSPWLEASALAAGVRLVLCRATRVAVSASALFENVTALPVDSVSFSNVVAVVNQAITCGAVPASVSCSAMWHSAVHAVTLPRNMPSSVAAHSPSIVPQLAEMTAWPRWASSRVKVTTVPSAAVFVFATAHVPSSMFGSWLRASGSVDALAEAETTGVLLEAGVCAHPATAANTTTPAAASCRLCPRERISAHPARWRGRAAGSRRRRRRRRPGG